MYLGKFVLPLLLVAFIGVSWAQDDGALPMSDTDEKELNQFFAGFGPATIDNITIANDVAYQFYGGKLWELTNWLAFKALAEATTDFDQSVMASGNVGANFYPIENDIAPYIGGRVGLGYVRDETDSDVFGVDLGSSLGLQLFRSSSTQINVETAASVLLRELQQDVNPVTFSARIGVLF